jgi:hypothetical protein
MRPAPDRLDDLDPLTFGEQRLAEHSAWNHLAVERYGNSTAAGLDARGYRRVGDARALVHLNLTAVELDHHA